MGLRARLHAIVLQDLPEADSKLGEPSPRWDELLGGRISPGKWKHFETGYGTTCGAVVDGWLTDAEAPPQLINASPEDGGSGYTIGASISRLIRGASELGWLRKVERGVLPAIRPGDIFRINRQSASGEHVGVALRVTPSADGQSLEVETADGGQGTREQQTATRNIRTFSLSSGAHPIAVQSPFNSGWLEEWVAVGGDEADEPDGFDVPGDVSSNAGQFVLGALGVLLLVSGAAWYITASKDRHLLSMRSVDDAVTLDMIYRNRRS